jgi:cellulose synthase operon protein C
MTAAEVQRLYDRHRYLDAFAASAGYWTSSTDAASLSTDELVLGGRLAERLGGSRLSRHLLRLAIARDPLYPPARFYAKHVKLRGRTVFDDLRDFENEPDIGGDDPVLRAAWYASFAHIWAALRDVERAHECLASAHAIAPDDAWVVACESAVLGVADRWEDALAAAERAVVIEPDAPFASVARATALLNLGRPAESAHVLTVAALNGQSFLAAGAAAWHQCALSETLDGAERLGALERASELLDRACALAPLADRDTRQGFARARLDVAWLRDDYAEIERWTEQVRSPFHRQVLANLRRSSAGRRIHLPYRRAIQKRDSCLPTSLGIAISANGSQISADEMAASITLGGTAHWAAADWLRERGYHVRSFAATRELSLALIRQGIAFVASFLTDESGHAVAVVGLDECAQTLLVHDPTTFRGSEYLFGILDAARSPLGVAGMAVVPRERAAELDALLPDDAAVTEGAQALQRALAAEGPTPARAIAAGLAERFPGHDGARLVGAFQLLADGQCGRALAHLHELLARFPEAPDVRRTVVDAYLALRNTGRLRLVLHDIVEKNLLPGLSSEQPWIRPPDRYICIYADVFRLSAPTRVEAARLLHSLIRRQPASAAAWHTLGDLLSDAQDRAGAALCLRAASCLEPGDEHYANAYAASLRALGRQADGLTWLECRARSVGSSPKGVGAWNSWISALDEHGDPEGAIAACSEALSQHAGSPEFLTFAVPFLARIGLADLAAGHLAALQSSGNEVAFHEAASQFHLVLGELTRATEHARSWVRDSSHSMQARSAVLGLLAITEGPDAAVEQAKAWVAANPGHEALEDVYGVALGRAGSASWKKYGVFRRRTRRNREDAVAWVELANLAIDVYAATPGPRRARLAARIEPLLGECERTAAGSVPALLAQAKWAEACGDWAGAVSRSVETLERDPSSIDACARAWRCAARFDEAERSRVWGEIKARLLNAPGRLSIARVLTSFLVERFGASRTIAEVEEWRLARPDDPDVLEAAVDLLLEHGGGVSAATRALALARPAAERFPHHFGLRGSLFAAYRATGEADAAKEILLDLVRRQPTNLPAQMQLAWMEAGAGDADAACRRLAAAEERDPQNPEVVAARVAVLRQAQRPEEARAVIATALARMERNVTWRERAVSLLLDLDAVDDALAAARHGVAICPRSAPLWLVLARAMLTLRRQFMVREAEECLRAGLACDASHYACADLLVCCLVDREQHDEAVQVLESIEARMADPSPARGRLAWVERQRTQGARGVEAMAAAVAAAPWYEWGWFELANWLEHDQHWDRARLLFGRVPEQLSHSLGFRHRRLRLLRNAGVAPDELDAEWKALAREHPDNESFQAPPPSEWDRAPAPATDPAEPAAKPSPFSNISPWAWIWIAWILLSLLRGCPSPLPPT